MVKAKKKKIFKNSEVTIEIKKKEIPSIWKDKSRFFKLEESYS